MPPLCWRFRYLMCGLDHCQESSAFVPELFRETRLGNRDRAALTMKIGLAVGSTEDQDSMRKFQHWCDSVILGQLLPRSWHPIAFCQDQRDGAELVG